MRLIFVSAILFGLAACGGGLGNKGAIDREARGLNSELRSNAAVKDVQIQGRAFRVAIVEGYYKTLATDSTLQEFVLRREDTPYALVTPGDGGSYRASDLEVAARSASGCSGSFNGGVLAFLSGDLRASDLSELESKVSNFRGWRVDLAC